MRDKGHRDHARHTGEEPTTRFLRGPTGLKVTLDTWGPKELITNVIHSYLQANWGDHPAKVEHLTMRQMEYVRSCFNGQTLQQLLEGISFWFTIDGVSRACTHQMVRTRLGCAIMQHGGRDNDWRHRDVRLPETMYRAFESYDGKAPCAEGSELLNRHGLKTCILKGKSVRGLEMEYKNAIHASKAIYAKLVDAGIPWQDARRVLPIGCTTYLHGVYNYVALKGMLSNRLEHIMDWEINCVSQLMVRELRMKLPAYMSLPIMSHSDRSGEAKYAGLDSWPADGKWPVPDWAKAITHRTHVAEQNPFWVLTEDAMNGGDVEWVPTDGVYPHEDVRVCSRRDDVTTD